MKIVNVLRDEKAIVVAAAICLVAIVAGDTLVRAIAGGALVAAFLMAIVTTAVHKEGEQDALDDLTEVIQQRLNDIDEQKTVRDALLVTSQYGVELQDLLWQVLPQLPPDVKREYVDKTLAARSVYLELHPAGEVDPKAMWEIRRALLEPPKPPEGFQM